MSRQTSKRMAKEKCHDSISSVATQMTEIEEDLCRDKRQRVATEHEKNVTNQLRQRKKML